ncbi:MAG TPA: DUF2470 domain-containing protein [Acetobacteraceae bacterium]
MAIPDSNDRELVPWTVRRLIRAARSASLATIMSGDCGGSPFASLVTPATAPDLSLLLLLSDLAEHTRYLRDDPRCSVLMTAPKEMNNPQTTARVTVSGLANLVTEPSLKARYLARHPYAAFYADFGDFHIWRINLIMASFVGGFARAARLQASEFVPDANSVAAIAEAEPLILERCNRDHANALARIAGSAGDWHLVALDVDGCDLSHGDRVIRIAWSAPLDSPQEIHAELLRLAGQQT